MEHACYYRIDHICFSTISEHERLSRPSVGVELEYNRTRCTSGLRYENLICQHDDVMCTGTDMQRAIRRARELVNFAPPRPPTLIIIISRRVVISGRGKTYFILFFFSRVKRRTVATGPREDYGEIITRVVICVTQILKRQTGTRDYFFDNDTLFLCLRREYPQNNFFFLLLFM